MARTSEEIKASVTKTMFADFGEIEGVVSIVKYKSKGGATVIQTGYNAELTVGQGLELLKAGWRTLRSSHFSPVMPSPGTAALVKIADVPPEKGDGG